MNDLGVDAASYLAAGQCAVELLPALGPRVPVVLDSPHSGSTYPPDFRHAVSFERIRRMEDAFVDELFASAPDHGATFVRALFPRAYIDPNRRPDDLDAALLDSHWPGEINPGPKVKMGIGLVAKRDMLGALYDRRLSVAEVEARISRYYWPYHRTLETALDEAHAGFGVVWHLNCHSMKSSGSRPRLRVQRERRADFCIGDQDGTTCSASFTEVVVETLRDMGYGVSVNDPYKGVELVSRYSAPAGGRHSMQVEINRALYMNEMKVCKHDGFDELARNLDQLVQRVCEFACAQ